MAMRELTAPRAPHMGFSLSLDQCHKVVFSFGRVRPQSCRGQQSSKAGSDVCHCAVESLRRTDPLTAGGSFWGQKRKRERLWREFFSDPSQWWDHRLEKPHARYPDFKHKSTQEGLWVDGKFNPPWVTAELAAMVPGSVELDLMSWNAMLTRFVRAGQHQRAMELFLQMQQEGVHPDECTFIPVLKACAGLRALEKGRSIHTQIKRSGYQSNAFVGTCLVDMYAKCGSIEDAWRVFMKMPTHDIVAWSAMIMGLVKSGFGQMALNLSRKMEQEGVEPDPFIFVGLLNACASLSALEEGRHFHKQIIQRGFQSNVFVQSSLVDMYAKCGSIEDALEVFTRMYKRDVVAWNAMITGLANCGQGLKIWDLWRQMQMEGVQPDAVTFVGLLNSCAIRAALHEGRHVHKQIIQRGFESNVYVGSSLIDMYAKCGSIEDAWSVFDNMSTRNKVIWNAMILGLVKCGQEQKALDLSRQMQREGLEPDPTTFVKVARACAANYQQ